MLVGLIGVFAARGQDAWDLARRVQPLPQKPSPEKRDEVTFAFKHQVLLTLMNGQHQRTLRSMLPTCGHIRRHHA
eukprot:8594148-Alexandrium_andersonii.AAC.1